MSVIDLEELNQAILNAESIGIFNSTPYTPSINSLSNVGYVSTPEIRNTINQLIFYYPKPDDFRISEELYYDIYIYMMDSTIPEENKNIVSKYMSEELKEKVFQEYLKGDFKKKNFKLDIDDVVPSYWFIPKIYGVPIKACFEKYDSIVIRENNLDYDSVIEFFKQKSDKANDFEFCLKLKCLFQADDYFTKKWCPKRIIEYIDELNKSDSLTDYQNNLCRFNNELIKKELLTAPIVEHRFHLDNDVKAKIVSSIPEDFSNVEKVIYIYNKLCQIFSYDSIYYIKEGAGNHSEVSNIENYNEENNNVVCYEFSYMLADILRDLGVIYIKERANKEQKFAKAHTNISFIVDEFVVFADSTTSVEFGDLSTSKYSTDLKGIRCSQYDEILQQEFNKAKSKVRSYMEYQDMQFELLIPNPEFIHDLNDQQKVVLFNNYLTNCNVKNIDFLAYANKLISVLELNIATSVYYDNKTESKILLRVDIDTYSDYKNDRISYFIDSTDKRVYDATDDLYTLKGQLGGKGR